MKAPPSKLSRLVSASAPFVARTFRGARLRRYGALNGVLLLLTVLGGVWLAFGTGFVARDFRVSIGAETPWHERARQEFKVIVFDPEDFERAVANHNSPEHNRDAHRFLHAAAQTPAPDTHWALATQAAELAARYPLLEPVEDRRLFWWDVPENVERLQAIVDRELVPLVELYRSPMNAADGVRVVGGIGGFVALILLLFAAPLLAGVQIAQEAHANTLPPVLGSRLSPRGVVLGLTAGGVAVPVFWALPQLIAFVVAAVVTGAPAHALSLIAVTLAAAAVLTMLSQLVGLAMGRGWAPGFAGIVLCTILGFAMFLGLGLAWHLSPGSEGVINVLPPVGPAYLLQDAFFPAHELGKWEEHAWRPAFALVRVAFSALAFGVLAAVATSALTRRITPRCRPALTPVEGFVAAAFTAALAIMAMPDFSGPWVTKSYVLSLGVALIPFSAILAGRVPLGGLPKMTSINLRSLLAEFGGYVGLHTLIALVALGFDVWFSPIGTILLLWVLLVVALVTIRSVAVPLGLGGAVFGAFALCIGLLHFVIAVAAFLPVDHRDGPSEFLDLPLWFLPLELLALYGIPAVLLRALRKGSAALQ